MTLQVCADLDEELSVLLPCFDEAKTVATCVDQAIAFLTDIDIAAEIVVADNGSTDGSQQVAKAAGGRIVSIPDRHYASALLGGIEATRRKYLVIGDPDASYDFAVLILVINRLRAGAGLVIGNRFRGGIMPGATPALRRHLGNRVPSLASRLFFQIKVVDFHCGLRRFRRDSALPVGLQSFSIEFASEMVARAMLTRHRVEELSSTLSVGGRCHRPYTLSWRDGWRQLLDSARGSCALADPAKPAPPQTGQAEPPLNPAFSPVKDNMRKHPGLTG